MSFTKRFDDKSKRFLKNKNQMFNMRNQKQNLIKSAKKVIVDLFESEIEQIKFFLLKMIEILKANLKKKRRKFIETNSNTESNRKQILHN